MNPEFHSAARLFAVIWSTCFLTFSCGSVHQMMPTGPLRPNEFQSNLVLSCDLNGFAPLSLSMNFYWGAGNDYNVGFGYEPPVSISHITAVKYLNPDKQHFGNLFASLMSFPLASGYSPDLEVGGGYIVDDGRSVHSISTGLWAGFYENTAKFAWQSTPRSASENSKFRPRPHPFLRYEFAHEDLRLSIRNNAGLTRRVLLSMRRRLDGRKPITIRYSDIQFVELDSTRNESQIALRDESRYTIIRQYPGVDAWGPDLEQMRLRRFNLSDSYDYYRIFLPGLHPDWKGRLEKKPEIHEISLDSLRFDYANKRDIILGPHPERTRRILELVGWHKHHWSIGIGTIMGRSAK